VTTDIKNNLKKQIIPPEDTWRFKLILPYLSKSTKQTPEKESNGVFNSGKMAVLKSLCITALVICTARAFAPVLTFRGVAKGFLNKNSYASTSTTTLSMALERTYIMVSTEEGVMKLVLIPSSIVTDKKVLFRIH
jgi:hypothetical protein